LVDVRMTFEHQLSGIVESANGDTVVRMARAEDVVPLQGVARQSYYGTRFYFDQNFPRQLCDLLYEEWIKASIEGYADAVLVAELDGIPVGYISCHLDRKSSTGKIGLVGVSSRVRGQNIGRTLVSNVLEWFSAQGTQKVIVVTQGRNYLAQRCYQRCGFLTKKVHLWYHKWYARSDTT